MRKVWKSRLQNRSLFTGKQLLEKQVLSRVSPRTNTTVIILTLNLYPTNFSTLYRMERSKKDVLKRKKIHQPSQNMVFQKTRQKRFGMFISCLLYTSPSPR